MGCLRRGRKVEIEISGSDLVNRLGERSRIARQHKRPIEIHGVGFTPDNLNVTFPNLPQPYSSVRLPVWKKQTTRFNQGRGFPK